jgi:hypothetical protein
MFFHSDGPYRGTLIDRETQEPIEGAAVLAVRRKETPMIAEAQMTHYDAQETVTDHEGNFTIPGITGGSVNPLAKIREPLFTIFKPSYKVYNARRLSAPDETGLRIIALRHLETRGERLKNLASGDSHVPFEKYPNLLRRENEERVNLGLRPGGGPTKQGVKP